MAEFTRIAKSFALESAMISYTLPWNGVTEPMTRSYGDTMRMQVFDFLIVFYLDAVPPTHLRDFLL